jgi:hypothetical protein
MVRLVVAIFLALSVLGCGSRSAPLLATFTREWQDGRVETLELYADGRVLMNHVGYIDRVTLSSGDVETLRAALRTIGPARDPTAFPRLTLAVPDGPSVIVDAEPGTVGALFVSLLDRHRLP